jgi:hypothetical protein
MTMLSFSKILLAAPDPGLRDPSELPINQTDGGGAGNLFSMIHFGSIVFFVLFGLSLLYAVYLLIKRNKEDKETAKKPSFIDEDTGIETKVKLPEELNLDLAEERLADWYETPKGDERYWDGSVWTDQYREAVHKESGRDFSEDRLTEADVKEYLKERKSKDKE